MELSTFSYEDSKWSVDSFPNLDSSETVVFIFGGSEFLSNNRPIEELCRAYPNSHILGCSTSGEIHGNLIHDNSLIVGVSKFEKTALHVVSTNIKESSESFSSGREIAEKLSTAQENLTGILVLSDGLSVNGSELVKGINSSLEEAIVVTGGLAGDGDRFKKTWVLCNSDCPQSNIVCAIGFYGSEVLIGHGSQGGWDVFGPERKVTKSLGNVLYEIDDKPALQLYKEYLGDRAKELPASALLFPLSVRSGIDDKKSIVRTILSVDEKEQSMIFAGDIPEGYLIQLMRANFDRLIQGSYNAAVNTCNKNSSSGDTLAIAVSCVGRRLVLGERTEEELDAALSVLSNDSKLIGFYSYGEISPFATGHCDLHNQTMTLTTISER